MANSYLGEFEGEYDNPYGSNQLNPDLILATNQITRDVDNVTTAVQRSLSKNITGLSRKVENATKDLPTLVLHGDGEVACQAGDCIQLTFKWVPNNDTELPILPGKQYPNGDGSYKVVVELLPGQQSPIALYGSLGTVTNLTKECIPCLSMGSTNDGQQSGQPTTQGPYGLPTTPIIGNTSVGPNPVFIQATNGVDSVTNCQQICPPPNVFVNPTPVTFNCPAPIVKVDVKTPEISLGDIIVKVTDAINKCPTPVVEVSVQPTPIEIINKVECKGTDFPPPPPSCETSCEGIEDTEEKEKCLERCNPKEPNWLRFLISKDGQEKMKKYSDEMGYHPPFIGEGPIFTAIEQFSNQTTNLLRGKITFQQGITN